MRRRIFLTAIAAFALLPSTATAASLSVSNGTLTYTGGAGAGDVDLGEPSPGTIQVAPQPDDDDAITPGTRLRSQRRHRPRGGDVGRDTLTGVGATRRARLSKRCTYRVRMAFAGSLRARFGGNAVLRPARARSG